MLHAIEGNPTENLELVLFVDDNNVEEARQASLLVFVSPENEGYGGNQKTCYLEALALGVDIAVMIHPDHLNDVTVIPRMVRPLLKNEADEVFCSQMLDERLIEGGNPWWNDVANVLFTVIVNLVIRRFLPEIHSDFRAISRKNLQTVRLADESDDFVFDTEIISQGMGCKITFQEVPIVTRNYQEASSINIHDVFYTVLVG